MWKRVLVAMLALVGTFSVVAAMNADMFANTTTYNAGGAVTGRVNKAPAGLTIASGNTSIGMQKGDKVLIGEAGNAGELGFQLLKYKSGYTDYDTNIVALAADGTIANAGAVNNAISFPIINSVERTPVNSWLSLASANGCTTVTKNYVYVNGFNVSINSSGSPYMWHGGFSNTLVWNFFLPDVDKTNFGTQFNSYISKIDANKVNYKIIAPRDLSASRRLFQSDVDASVFKLTLQTSMKHTLFIPDTIELGRIGGEITKINELPPKDSTFSNDYWMSTSRFFVNGATDVSGLIPDAGILDVISGTTGASGTVGASNMAAFRPALNLNMDNVVFATSKGDRSGIATASQPKLTSDYTSIYNETLNDKDMKVRVHNSSMTATLSGLMNASATKPLIRVIDGKCVVAVNSTIQITASANSFSNSTVSVLMFDKDGNFKYYRPLEAAKGAGNYAFDTTGIPLGEYQIAVVNEVYDDNSSIPADCSTISSVDYLRIVDPLNFSVSPMESTLEYGMQSSVGQVVATASNYQNGVGNPSFSLVWDGAETEGYSNFELSTNAHTSLPVNVKIKADAPALVNGSLKAGKYEFRLIGHDENESDVFSYNITVTVTQASSTLNITSTTSIEDLALGKTISGTFATNNKDLSSSITPTCEISGGQSKALSVSECIMDGEQGKFTVSADINNSGEKLPEEITLLITIPETDNYKKSSTVQKKFRVYKELNTFALANKDKYTTLEVDKGKSIGILSVKDGIAGYTYALTSASDVDKYIENEAVDNAKFVIGTESGKPVVIVNEKLENKRYFIQLKVTDVKGKTLYLSVEINVGLATQSELQFKDKAGGVSIEEVTFTYSSTNPTVYAEGGNASVNAMYKVALKQPNGSDNPQDILSADEGTGKLTLKKVGQTYVTATKSGGSEYSDVSDTILVKVTHGTQNIVFDEGTPVKHLISQGTFDVHAKVVGREDSSTPSNVTYTSLSESVCTVNSSSGKVTIKTAGECKIQASNADANYVAVNKPTTITIYGDLSAEFNQTMNPVKVGTAASSAVGQINNQSGGDSNYQYAMTSSLLAVSLDGIVTLKKVLTIDDLKDKWISEQKKYIINETITMTDGNAYSTTIPVSVICQGASLSNVSFNSAVDDTIQETYVMGKTIALSLSGNLGEGAVTYSKKEDALGVLTSVTSGGSVLINKAGDTAAIVEAVIEPKNGYEGLTLSVNIKVNKAKQTVRFDPILATTKKFEENGTFTVSAKGQIEGTTITYETSPSTVCTNVNNRITMVGVGDCTITAKGNLTNYEEASQPSTIAFYDGVSPVFKQTANNLQAKAEDATINSDIAVGTITTTGGLNKLRYAISTNEGDDNKAKDFFTISGSGALANVSLTNDIKASELAMYGTYDTIKDTYLLKFQVAVFDGVDDTAEAIVNCVVTIKGASFTPTFTFANNEKITKTYGDNYFDLSLQGNLGEGDVTYAMLSETDMPSDIITLSGTRVLIHNADDKTPTITADIKASAGYEKMQISTKVKINKATLNTFNFSDTNEESILLDGQVTPTFVGTLSGASIELKSANTTAITVEGNTLTAIATGTSKVSATTPLVSDTVAYRNYNQKTVEKVYKVYDALWGEIKQTNATMQVEEDSASENTLVGSFKYENGNGTVTVAITEGSEYFYKTGANKLYLYKNILREDLLWDTSTKSYYIPLTFTLNDDTDVPVELKKKITFIGASVPIITFKDAVDGKISRPYKLNERYPLDLIGYKDELGSALYGPVTYRLKDDSTPQDVVVDISEINDVYNVFMGNANKNSVTIEAVIEAGNGYQEAIIPCEFEITKAQQSFAFKAGAIDFKKGTSFTPQFTGIPKGNSGVVVLESEFINVVRVDGVKLFGVDAGVSKITATAAGNDNFEEAVVYSEATVYDDLSLTFVQELTLPKAGTDSAKVGSVVGTITLQGAVEPSMIWEPTHADNEFFKIAGTSLTINTDITAADLASKTWNEDKMAYEMQVEFTYSDKNNSAKTSTQTIYVKGATSSVSFKDTSGVATTKITKPYGKTPFVLELKNNVGDIWPYGAITYSLDTTTNTTNVLEKIEPGGNVFIKNANIVGNSEKVMAVASIAPANGYEGTSLACEIYITKATQPDFAFATSIELELPGEVEPLFRGLLSSEPLSNVSIVDQSIATYDTNTNKIIAKAAGTTKITATSSVNDRNYAVATTPEVDVTVRNKEGYTLQIKVPEPATYGDTTPLKAEIEIDDSIGTEKTQEWFSSNEDVASIDKESGVISIHHAGRTLLHVKQTTNLEPEKESPSLWFIVKQKQISVQIANKEKYVGQDVPAFDFEVIIGLVEGDEEAFVQPHYICQDENGDYVDAYTAVGTYAIEGQFEANVNKDYNITLLAGALSIKQDTSLRSWYEVQSETQPIEGWFNKPVTLKLIQADGSYDKISDDMKGPWDETIVVSEEGVQEKDVYFKDTTANKIASPQAEEIKVDETAPRITSIAGNETNTGPAARFLHTLTLKQFFKQGSEIVITAEDVIPKEGIQVSDIAKIEYKIYKDSEDEEGNTLVKEGSVEDSKAVVVLNEPDDYTVCAIAYDNAGNATNEECQKATVKKIDVDVDGDEKLDFNDSDDDGCPDLNIKWKDGENWITINGDQDNDGIPDLNIDSDGDGKIDLNIDTDNDKSPDLNLVILQKSDWIPTKCVNTQVEEYCTGTTVQALINVDTTNDWVPEHDISTNGDMKANINIIKDGKIKLNINTLESWDPKTDFKKNSFAYDTMADLKPYLNIDSNDDGFPDINVDLTDDGKADINIDMGDDGIPDIDIDSNGDGIPDMNIDSDGDGVADREIMDLPEWKPSIKVEGDVSYDTIKVDRKDSLEDKGIIMTKNKGKFLPSYLLQVNDITQAKQESLKGLILNNNSEQIIAAVYEIELLQNNVPCPLQDIVTLQIPILNDITNTKLWIVDEEDKAASLQYESIDGFYEVSVDILHDIVISGDIKTTIEEEVKTPENIGGKVIEPMVSGVATGDTTNILLYLNIVLFSGMFLTILYRKYN